MLKTKSIRTAIDRGGDGLRILVARFRGRGVPGIALRCLDAQSRPERAHPADFAEGAISWKNFSKQYRAELFLDGPIDKRSRTIKNHGQKFTLRLLKRLALRENVTLLCHCAEDERHCHRHVLRALITGTQS
jgi:uncharacterized protein YeaO (DUF488 family)